MAQETVDPSLDPRRSILQRAMTALSQGRVEEASVHLAAAIRKARKRRLWDVEAEYLRFCTLALAGDHSEAINRCVTCFEALEEIEDDTDGWPVDRLPITAVRRGLEEALIGVMARRGDGVWAITVHIWRRHAGRFYPGKTDRPFGEAARRAWEAVRTPPVFGIDTLTREFKPFSAALEAKYAEGEAAAAAASSSRPRAVDSSAEAPAPRKDHSPFSPAEEDRATDLLDDLINTDEWKGTADLLEDVHEACRRCVRPDNVARLARLFAHTPPREARGVLAAIRENQALSREVAEGKHEGARADFVRFLHMAFGAPKDGTKGK